MLDETQGGNARAGLRTEAPEDGEHGTVVTPEPSQAQGECGGIGEEGSEDDLQQACMSLAFNLSPSTQHASAATSAHFSLSPDSRDASLSSREFLLSSPRHL